MKLICEICHTYIGQFDHLTIFEPIAGVMFTSPRPRREVPPPFAPSLGWVDMRCPVCRKRPMIKPHRIMISHPRCFETSGTTTAAYFKVPERAREAAKIEVVSASAEEVVQTSTAAPPVDDTAVADEEGPRICATCGKEYTSHENLMRYHHPCPKLAKGNED